MREGLRPTLYRWGNRNNEIHPVLPPYIERREAIGQISTFCDAVHSSIYISNSRLWFTKFLNLTCLLHSKHYFTISFTIDSQETCTNKQGQSQNHMYHLLVILKIEWRFKKWFIWSSELWQREKRDIDWFSICWFLPQMATVIKGGQAGAESFIRVSHMFERDPRTCAICCHFPRPLTDSQISNGANRTKTYTKMKCWCHKWKFYPGYNSSPTELNELWKT